MARKAAVEGAMQEAGLDVAQEMIVEGDHRMEGGMRALVQLASLPQRPTAILCSNDMTAVGVMREAYERGIVIPRDLSLVGFDDIRLSQFTTPPLTTVQMSQTLLAEYAFQALLREAQRNSTGPAGSEYELLTTLVLRRSTALAPLDGMTFKAPNVAAPDTTADK